MHAESSAEPFFFSNFFHYCTKMWCYKSAVRLTRQLSGWTRQSSGVCGICMSHSSLLKRPRLRYSSSEGAPPDAIGSPVPPLSDQMQFVKVEGLNLEEERRLQILQFEAEVLRQSAFQIPTEISAENWRKILEIQSKHSRLKYYRYLFKTEMYDLAEKRKKAELQKVRKERSELIRKDMDENPDAMRYGLSMNTMFPYIRDTAMLATQNMRIARARCIGQPLVIDCDYDQWMADREQVNTAIQLRDAYAYNRDSRDPFWLQLTNVRTDGLMYSSLLKAIANIGQPSNLIEISSKSYLDLFPKEKIVYLTYNAEYTLTDFNEDDVYVIGALVDKTQPKPLTMAKAKREGLRMAKLPIDVHLRWAVGNKNLTINQVVAMMCDVKLHGDWEKALTKHIPKRKLFQPEDYAQPGERAPREPYHKRSVSEARRRKQGWFNAQMEMMTE